MQWSSPAKATSSTTCPRKKSESTAGRHRARQPKAWGCTTKITASANYRGSGYMPPKMHKNSILHTKRHIHTYKTKIPQPQPRAKNTDYRVFCSRYFPSTKHAMTSELSHFPARDTETSSRISTNQFSGAEQPDDNNFGLEAPTDRARVTNFAEQSRPASRRLAANK